MEPSTTPSGAGAGAGAGSSAPEGVAEYAVRDAATRAGLASADETVTPRLTPIHLAVRIKPMSAEKAGGTTGVACNKRLHAWDVEGSSVTMRGLGGESGGEGRDGVRTWRYAQTVLPPEASQAHTYDTLIRPLVDEFVAGTDVNVLCFGQTGSGKTHTMFGPPHSMAAAGHQARKHPDATAAELLRDEHGVFLRAAFQAVEAVQAINATGRGCGIITGSMVELWIGSFTSQSCNDLLDNKVPCLVDEDNKVQGATQLWVERPADAVKVALALETRTTKATRCNDTSSRSHCIATLTLHMRDTATNTVRESRINFFDMMGSERFKGNNAAHDTRISSKATIEGWEGIFANFSLSCLHGCIVAAKQKVAKDIKAGKYAADGTVRARGGRGRGRGGRRGWGRGRRRRSGGGMKEHGNIEHTYRVFSLTRLFAGSLVGHARSAMILTLSQAPRNGDEVYCSLRYGEGVAGLQNVPGRNEGRPYDELLKHARTHRRDCQAVLARGVVSKYATKRKAAVRQWTHLLKVLKHIGGVTEGEAEPVSEGKSAPKK